MLLLVPLQSDAGRWRDTRALQLNRRNPLSSKLIISFRTGEKLNAILEVYCSYFCMDKIIVCYTYF